METLRTSINSSHSSISSDTGSFVFVSDTNSKSYRSMDSNSGNDIMARGVAPNFNTSRQCSSSSSNSGESSSLKYFESFRPTSIEEKDLIERIKRLVLENDKLKTTLKADNEALKKNMDELEALQDDSKKGKDRLKIDLRKAYERIAELEASKKILEKRGTVPSPEKVNNEAVQKLVKELKTKFEEVMRKLVNELEKTSPAHGQSIGVSLHPELEASLLEQLEHSMKECVENTYVYITNPTDVSFKDQTHEIVFLKEAIENLKLEVQDKNQEIENYKGQEIENRKNILEFQKIQSENEKLKRANAYLHQRVQDLEHKSVEFGHGPPVAQSNNVMLEELKKQFEQQKMANVTLHKEVQRLNEKLEEVITDNERLMSENFEAGRKLKSIESKENDKQIGDEQSKVEFEAAVSTLTAELNYTKDELKCAKNELTKRTEEYLGIEGEVKELRARLEEKIEKEENAQKSAPQDEQEIEELKKKIEMFRKREVKDSDRINDLLSEKDNSKEEIAKLTKELEEQHVTVQELQGQIASLCQVKTSSEEEEGKLKESIQKLAEKNTAYDKNIQDLQRQHTVDSESLEKVKEENYRLRQELNEMEAFQETNAMLEGNMQRLLKENQELDAKVQELNAANERQHELTSALMAKDTDMQNLMRDFAELQRSRKDDGEIIQRLQDQLKAATESLDYERNYHMKDQQQLAETMHNVEVLERSRAKLLKDYNDLWSNYSTKVSAQEQRSKESENLNETLKAKIHQMEELLNTTVDENQNLQNEKENLENQLKKAKEQTRHLEGELETVPVLREQVGIYESDFRAEREAREKQQGDILHLRDQLTRLQLENKRLQDEVDSHGRHQMREMQRRHAAGTAYGASSSQQGGYPHQAISSVYSSQDTPSGYPGYNTSNYGTMYARGMASVSDGMHGGAGRQGNDRNAAAQEPDQPVQRTCPKCRQAFPDLDTLQIHVMECIDE